MKLKPGRVPILASTGAMLALLTGLIPGRWSSPEQPPIWAGIVGGAGASAASLVADAPSQAVVTWPQISLVEYVSGLSLPVHITNAGDDTGRVFVVEQAGRIRIVRAGSLEPTPFLDLSSTGADRVLCCGERGLLSLAFPPGFASKRYFYVNYTRKPDGATVVARYTLSADPDLADPNSEQVILTIEQPFPNHNGGQLAFGLDGYLYIGTGDGGSGGDPLNNAQNPASLLGKILRIDVEFSGPGLTSASPPVGSYSVFLPAIFNGGSTPYAIPPDNPFVGITGARPEIWALGLRNPWRFSFDRETGDLFIGDVGQDLYEEVDYQAVSSPGGENYGWNIMEGMHCYNAASCDTAGLTLPVVEYEHGPGDSIGCSITGGVVYRGPGNPGLQGMYFYGDYCQGRIWGLQYTGGAWVTTQLLDTPYSISTFGEDQAGNVLLADYSTGRLFQLVEPPSP